MSYPVRYPYGNAAGCKCFSVTLLFAGSYCCWLKSGVPKREPNEDATSGIVKRERYRHPPTGMRSAVPLGGLGTGSFELRADGKDLQYSFYLLISI